MTARKTAANSGEEPTIDAVAGDDSLMNETLASCTGDSETVRRETKQLGNYEIIDEIARGGMGVVYRARQINADRIVALKLIRGTDPDSKELERFEAEAKAAAKLDHPNIVPIYDVGLIAGEPFFTMKLVEGASLSGKLDGKPIEARLAARIVRDVAAGIAHAHQNNIIHRDLKPGNVLLDVNDKPLVTDFGLAKLSDDESELTRTGQAIGTPAYMPPEQASGDRDKIDHRSDVYSLGALLYACLTGRPPFQGQSAMATVMAVMKDEPVSPRLLNADVPKDLETLCLKCLEKQSKDRYQTALDFHDDLSRYLANEPVLARPVSHPERVVKWIRRNPLATGLIAAVLLAAAGLSAALVAGAYSERLARSLDDATEQREVAESERKKSSVALHAANELAKQRDAAEYTSQIALAQLAYRDGHFSTTSEILEKSKPNYRQWEHVFLEQQLHRHRTLFATSPDSSYVNSICLSSDGTMLAAHTMGTPATIAFFRIQANGVDLPTPLTAVATHELPDYFDPRSRVFSVQDMKQGFVFSGINDQGSLFVKFDLAATKGESIVVNSDASNDYGEILCLTSNGDSGIAKSHTNSLLNGKNACEIVRFGERIITQRLDTPSEFQSACFSPDSRTGYALRNDEVTQENTFVAFEIETGDLIMERNFEGSGIHRQMAISPDGKTIVVPDGRRAKLVDTETLQTVATSSLQGTPIASICFDRANDRVYAGHRSGEVTVYRAGDLVFLQKFFGQYQPITSLVVRPDNRRLVVSGQMSSITSCEVNQSALTKLRRVHDGPVQSLAVDPSSEWIASSSNVHGGSRESLWLTSLRAPTQRREFASDGDLTTFHLQAVQQIGFSSDGTTLLTADYKQKIYFWDVADGTVDEILDLQADPGLMYLSFSPSQRYCVTCGNDKTASLINVDERKIEHQVRSVEGLRVAFIDEENATFYALGASGALYGWSMEDGRQTIEHRFGLDPPSAGATLLNPRRWFVGTATGRVQILDPATPPTNRDELIFRHEHTGVNSTIAVSPDGQRCVTACDDGRTILRDANTLEAIMNMSDHERPITTSTFSPDGKRIVAGDFVGNLYIWDASGE